VSGGGRGGTHDGGPGRGRPAGASGDASAGESGDHPASRRVFIAVPLPEPALREVTALVESVRAKADPDVRDVRWVRLDGLHLTLRFIGLVAEERLEAIGTAMDRVAGSTAPFEVVVAGAGAFPTTGRPRALWLDLAVGRKDLAAAAAALEDELAVTGLERSDRPYRAHLTVARADGVRAGADVARRLIEAATGLEATFTAGELVLFQTIQGGGPARYERLRSTPLQGVGGPRNETATAGSR
jgi:RNA 2',3'-cyclic 3'-phosphodiesterase